MADLFGADKTPPVEMNTVTGSPTKKEKQAMIEVIVLTDLFEQFLMEKMGEMRGTPMDNSFSVPLQKMILQCEISSDELKRLVDEKEWKLFRGLYKTARTIFRGYMKDLRATLGLPSDLAD
jgi:hypothetical protein